MDADPLPVHADTYGARRTDSEDVRYHRRRYRHHARFGTLVSDEDVAADVQVKKARQSGELRHPESSNPAVILIAAKAGHSG